MPEDKALVRSTSDREQVKEAGKKVAHRRDVELADLREVLEMPAGRRLLWRLMGFCRIHESTFDGHGAKQSYNCGRQDVGHYIMAEVMEARRDAFAQMMTEAEEERKRNG